MSALSEYLDDYASRHPGVRERWRAQAREFFRDCEDIAQQLGPACAPSECTKPHLDLAGPNMDIGQCPDCWMPVGVMRPHGESFGWHIEDCALDIRHAGYCEPGGNGHEIPDGWKLRG